MGGRPNVLHVLPDQHRFDWVGYLNRIPVRTPTLDAIAMEGVAFKNAVCPSPLCGPSRACLATGKRYDSCGVDGNSDDLPPDVTTYYERLRDEAGYRVGGVGKFDLHKGTYGWGVEGTHKLRKWGFSTGTDCAGKIDGILSLVFENHPSKSDLTNEEMWNGVQDALKTDSLQPQDPYTAYLHSEGLLDTHVEDYLQRQRDRMATFPTPLPDEAYCDNWIGRQALRFIENSPQNQPWYLVVNFSGPHDPWDITERMHSLYREPAVTFEEPERYNGRIARDHHQEIRRNYATMIENLDRWMGRFLNRIEQRGERDETVVVFASDHGEMLGDHGRWGKKTPYQSSAGVPLILGGPDIPSRGVVSEPASTIDLHATFLDYAGVEGVESDGHSLRPYLEREVESHREYVTSALNSWRMTYDGRYKLIRGFSEEDSLLFDRGIDPFESENVAADNPDVVARLETHM